MAPHLSAQEMDFLRGLLGKGLSLVQIHGRLVAQRARKDMAAPSLPNVRKVLKGQTYRQGLAETRGRKKKLSSAHVNAMDKARQDLIRKAKGQHEVHWEDIMRKARVRNPVSIVLARTGVWGQFVAMGRARRRVLPVDLIWHSCVPLASLLL